MFAGIVVLMAALDVGAGPEVVTWPLLLAGLGVGALASQLGSVTVSSVPDEQSGEVGGVQNTMTNLGASIGTALAGAVLIAALTSSFLSGISDNPAVPASVSAQAGVELGGGVPFVSDADLQAALAKAGIPSATADAIVEENTSARIRGLQASLGVLAGIALVALFFTRLMPTRQPGADGPTSRPRLPGWKSTWVTSPLNPSGVSGDEDRLGRSGDRNTGHRPQDSGKAPGWRGVVSMAWRRPGLGCKPLRPGDPVRHLSDSDRSIAERHHLVD